MRNIVYDKLINELSLKFKTDLTEEEYNVLLPLFIQFVDDKYGVFIASTRDENDSFYQNCVRNECLKICKFNKTQKQSLLIKDEKLVKLRELSFSVFSLAKDKLLTGINTLNKEDITLIKNQVSELFNLVLEYNKKKAEDLYSETILDLEYCDNNSEVMSFRLAALNSENIKEKNK